MRNSYTLDKHFKAVQSISDLRAHSLGKLDINNKSLEMENRENKIQEYYEALVNNHEKGETYTIKFRDNPVIYKGIPMMPRFHDDDNKFIFKILSPPKYKGVKEMTITEIEHLEKQPY